MAGTLRAEATLALANLLFLVSSCWAGSSCRSTGCRPPSRQVARGPAAGRPDPGPRDRARARDRATRRESLALLAGWAVVLAVLAAWRFRWD